MIMYSLQKHIKMATYSVVFEIELDADNPLKAAKKAQKWLQEKGNNWQYYIQGDDQKINSVDLSEDDEDAVLPVVDYDPLIK